MQISTLIAGLPRPLIMILLRTKPVAHTLKINTPAADKQISIRYRKRERERERGRESELL